MRRMQDWDIRIRSRRVQRICEQVIIKDILVTPEAGVEIVQSPFKHPQPADIVGVAAISEVAERHIVKQQARMGRRVHVQRILQQPWAGTEVYKCVPNSGVAAEIGDSSAKLGRLFDLIATDSFSRNNAVRNDWQIVGLAR